MEKIREVAPLVLPEANGKKEKLLSVDDIVFAVILTITAGLLANL